MTAAQMRYLYKIYEISNKKSEVLSADVARKLNVSKPSVVKMLSVLSEKRMVEKEYYGRVNITEKGIEAAKRFEICVNCIKERLPKTGLPLDEAEIHKSACTLVGVLPSTTLDRIMQEA